MNVLATEVEVDAQQPIEFIDNSSFQDADADAFLSLPAGQSIYADETNGDPVVHESGDYEQLRGLPLLSTVGETFLFRKMNYLKHQAEVIRQRIATRKTRRNDKRKLADLVADADAVRNHIAECNLRLVISIARKFSNSTCEFDELMSEGNEILLKAITKFDFSRGFRFSTYATHSVQRHFYRYTQRRQKRNSVEMKSSVELLNELPEGEADELITEWVAQEQRMTNLISEMAHRLDDREHRIVTARFGLTGDGVIRTLRELSAEMGLSKERIRQLQLVAVEKLRDLFDELDVASA